ncbi:MAG: alpha-2-macroglobulin family protein [Candidatus Aminicenantales bacterium]
MGKKYFAFLIFGILVLSLFSSIDCKRKEQNLGLPPDKAIGDLHVLHVSPKGSTLTAHESEEIVVIFDRPMRPLQALSEEEKTDILKIDPPYSGKYRWMGTKTLTFTPNKRFPYATEIKVTVPAGTWSLEGYTLKEDITWSFRTIRPRLINHFPQNGERQMRLETQVLLIFNQPLAAENAKDFISLHSIHRNGRESLVDFNLLHPSNKKLEEADIPASPDQVFLLEPKEKLQPDCIYSLELRSGLPGKEGPLGMEKTYSFSFETFNTFVFEDLLARENHSPNQPLQFKFSNRVTYKEFVRNIRFEPEVEIPDYYSSWDYGSPTLWISLPLDPEKEYQCWINADLKDEFGNRLGKEVPLSFFTSAYPPSISMTTGHGVIEAYSELSYPLYAMNSPGVFHQMTNVPKEEVIPLLTSARVFWSSEKFMPRQNFQIERPLDFTLPRNTRQVIPVPLNEALRGEKYGLIFLQLDTRSPDKWERYPKAFLQVTELGITGKFSPENNIIWVTELKTGLPVPEAEVEIRDDLNRACWKGRTDKDGKVTTPGWKPLGIKSKEQWTKPQQWVIARRGKDVAFISSEWGTGISPYRFNIDYDWNPQPERIKGYIFTERGIYRAGESVHIKGILRKREKGTWILPSGKEIECEIQDPFQKTVFKDKIPLDDYGSFAFDLETRAEASLGYYQIIAKVPPEESGEKATVVYSSFRVEAFKPAEFEVHLRALKENYVFGDEYKAEIRGNYLFGGAMSGQNVSWSLRLNRAYFRPPGPTGFVFGEMFDDWGDEPQEDSRLLASGESVLDEKGNLEVKIPLQREKEKGSALAILEATVLSPSRRSISNRIQTFVHQGEFYIGLKTDSFLLKKGETISVQVITTDPTGRMIPGEKISVKLFRREWKSIRKGEIGGRYRWITEKEDTEIAARQMQSQNDPFTISFKPEKSGVYLLCAQGSDNRKNQVTTTTYFYVTGRDYVPWERKDEDALELVPDSERYQPGDTSKILVKSPYERAKALVTIEREYILQSWVQDIQGSASTIEIPIVNSLIPNAYVSVLLVQGRTANATVNEKADLGKPSFKIGYVNLKVDPSAQRLTLDISSNQHGYKPKDKVSLRIRIKDMKDTGVQASIALAVVDVGVLNLIGYQTPNPFGMFYGEKPLSVQTSETRLHVVGQRAYGEKGENVGGGGGEELAAAPGLAEVELRGDFKSTAYWNPSLVTDARGEATMEFTLPDNLTTFRVMAVAQTRDSKFGQNELAFKVSKPLLLLPSLPRFARVGDIFEGGVIVTNYSSQKGNVILNLDATGIRLLDKKPSREFSLLPEESKECLFSFEVNTPGRSLLAFRARMREETDGLEISLPLYLPRPTETVALFDQTQESKEEKILIPENIYPEESKIEVQAAASALFGLKGCVDFLTTYPYLCLEQRLSTILPYLVAPQIIHDFRLSSLNSKEIKPTILSTLKEVYDCQHESGGFGLWPDSPYESPFISCYAVFALLKAQETGIAIERTRLDLAAAYLRHLLQLKYAPGASPYSLRNWKTVLAFALYDLALLGRPEPSYMETLFQERENLSLFGRALLLKALHLGKGASSARNTLLQELMNTIKVTAEHAHFEDDEGGLNWIYSSNLRTTAFILQTLTEVGSNHPLLPAMAHWLVDRRKAGHWHSTQENFFVFYALNDFYRNYEKVRADFKVAISLDKKRLLEEILQPPSPLITAFSPLTEFKAGRTLSLHVQKKGHGILYYGARLTYAPKEKLEPRDEGLAVYKKIETLDGKPIDFVKAGSLVMVTLQVVVPKESLFVVVHDPLPAGFEAVNPVFLTESEEQMRKLEAIEEQQERPWWEGFSHIEMHDDRVLLFADSLRPGIHTHRYLARALNPGLFTTPGTQAEEMYSPEVFGRSAEQVIRIEK